MHKNLLNIHNKIFYKANSNDLDFVIFLTTFYNYSNLFTIKIRPLTNFLEIFNSFYPQKTIK